MGVFLSTLRAMLAQGKTALAEKNEFAEPDNMIGWKDIQFAYLIPEAVRNEVSRYLHDSGGHFPHTKRSLYEALDGRGALVKGNDGKATRVIKIRRKNHRILQVPLALLESIEEECEDDG